MLSAYDVFDLLFAPGLATDWWSNLNGEDNKKKTGRFLVHTLNSWLKQQHHDSGLGRECMQSFFS